MRVYRCAVSRFEERDRPKRELAAHVERAPKSRRNARRALRLRDLLEERSYPRLRELLDPFFEFWMGRGEVFPPLDPALKEHLSKRFRPEIDQLEILLNREPCGLAELIQALVWLCKAFRHLAIDSCAGRGDYRHGG